MYAILVRKSFNTRNLRKFLLYSLSHNSTLRTSNPCLYRIARHESLSSVAHNYKSLENPNLRENHEASQSKDSTVKTIDQDLLNIDFSIQRIGRVVKNHVEEIYAKIRDLGESTKTQSLYLLRCCGLMRKEYPNERVEFAKKLWKELQDLGCQYDITHYNALLKVYVDNNHQFLPSDFLMTLESNKIEPNKVTFLHLMQKYCNDGNLDGASEVLEFMKEKGVPISENVFNTLITGHMNVNDVSGAKDIFDVMRSSNLSPSAESYVALACGYAKNGDIDEVKSVLRDMKDAGIVPSIGNYLYIVSSLSSEHLAFIDEVIDMLGEGIYEWKHAVLNTVLDLLNKNLCDSAFKLVLAICDTKEGNKYNTNIFLRQLIKTEQPIEKVIQYCKEIEKKGLNDLAMLNSAKSAIDYEKYDHASSFLQELQNRGYNMRCHQFWPMFSAKKSENDVLSILKCMFKFGIEADFLTFSQYIFPAMTTTNPEQILQLIQDTGFAKVGVIRPLFQYYCYNGYSDQALYLIRKYPTNVTAGFNLEKFIATHSNAVQEDPDSSFHQVLSYIISNIGMVNKDYDVIQGKTLASLIMLSPSTFQLWLNNSKDFIVSNKCLDVCYSILQSKNPNFLVHVQKLEYLSNRKRQRKPMTIEEENRELNVLKKKGLSMEPFLQQQLASHIKEKNVDRVLQLKTELENSGAVLTPITITQLFNFYKEQLDLEMAGKYLKTLRETYPDFSLETAHILNYVMLLIKYSKFEEALETIKAECQELKINLPKDYLIRSIRKLFDAAIETGNIDLVRNIQSSLVHHSKSLQVTKLFFEPLIKMHFFRNDLNHAVEEFRSINLHHKVSPCLTMLLKKCIIADDHVNLQAVVDSASTSEGKIAVLHELLWAFFETGRISQAIKVFKNLGPNVDNAFFENACNRLFAENNPAALLEFLSSIGDFEHIDGAKMFSFLFKIYDRRNEYKMALDLYNKIEVEELFVLSEQTKKLLLRLFRRNNIEVPSTLLDCEQTNKVEPSHKSSPVTRISDTSVEEFHEILEKGDANLALDKLSSMKKGLIRNVPLFDMSQLIRLLTEKRLLGHLSENVQAMSYLIENANDILYPVFLQYSGAGDIESLEQLAGFLPDFCLKKSSFNGFLCNAYLSKGKHEELLTEMENRWNKHNKTFSAISFLELLKIPHLQERAINLSKKFLEIKFDTPIAIVWAYYLINENYDAAEKIEKEYPVMCEKADSIILRAVKEKESVKIAQIYVDRINRLNVRLRAKERAYGSLLDVLVLKEMYPEAVDLIKMSYEQNINLGKHYRSTLITLKSALERESKHVPFTIPAEESILSV